MKEPILSREEVLELAVDAFGIDYDRLDGRFEKYAALIESALLEKLDMVPVVKVISWTNGSYHRNYQLQWSRDVEPGMQLYALNRSKA
ncbi:TPA: hypothetical protein QDA71_006724 [Burkholderia vietnamiensis]|nr:hypothetical protein [Burkholderia vietnamiensis]HDR9211305.1 hypothetical protein [Burkholderia vietnamiensis]